MREDQVNAPRSTSSAIARSSPRRTTLPSTGASPCTAWCSVSFRNHASKGAPLPETETRV
jgi:hypothetical protein